MSQDITNNIYSPDMTEYKFYLYNWGKDVLDFKPYWAVSLKFKYLKLPIRYLIWIVALLLTTQKRQMTNLSWQMTHVMAMYARKWNKNIGSWRNYDKRSFYNNFLSSFSMVNQLSYVILKQYLLGLQLQHSPKILHAFYLAIHIIRSWILDVTYSPLYTC